MEKNNEKIIAILEEGSFDLSTVKFKDGPFSDKVIKAFYNYFFEQSDN